MYALMAAEFRDFARDVAGREAGDALLEGLGVVESIPVATAALADSLGESRCDLRRAFGRRVFERFVNVYPDFIPRTGDFIEFMLGLEKHVHEEMRTLYDDVRPPRLACERLSETELLVRYHSDEPVAEMCCGMIEAAIEHFEADATVEPHGDLDANPPVFLVSLSSRPARR